MIPRIFKRLARVVSRKPKTSPSPVPHTLFAVTVMDAHRLRPMSAEPREAPQTREFERSREKFRIKLAGSENHPQDANVLIEKMYSWRGYGASDNRGEVPNRITLNAEFHGSTYGTITVSVDSPIGLACESAYPDVVQKLREQERTLCEFGKFAVEHAVRSKRLLATLFHMAYIYAHRLHGCTDALIEVNPRHIAFYQRYLGFEVFAEERHCDRVGAPAVLMRIDFDMAEKHIAELGGRWRALPDEKSFYKYFVAPDEEAKIVSRLKDQSDDGAAHT